MIKLLIIILVALILFLIALPTAGFTYEASDTEDIGGYANAFIGGQPLMVADAPDILAKISWCESRNNDLAQNPKSSARGRYQIIKSTEELAEKHLGADYDVFDPNDAQIIAEWLYERYGCKPWKASFNCHQCL